MNELVFGEGSGATTAAEESTAGDGVAAVYVGLGFGFKWNMGDARHARLYLARSDPPQTHHKI